MITMSVARIADTLRGDFRTAAGQLRQTGRKFKTNSQPYHTAADLLERWAASVGEVRPEVLVVYHELMSEADDHERHADLLRQIAFKGTAKTATDYVRAYISDRTGGAR